MAVCSKDNTRAKIMFATVVSVMMLRRKKQHVKKKQIKRFWRRGIFRDRKLHSEYYHLYQTLRDTDREFHYRYLRMSKERFDHLLSLVREKITKKNTIMREAISAEERLVITIRYLSSGMSQQDLCYSFRVGRTTVSNIIKETCVAIYDVLSQIYMRAPSTENQWRHIADDFEVVGLAALYRSHRRKAYRNRCSKKVWV